MDNSDQSMIPNSREPLESKHVHIQIHIPHRGIVRGGPPPPDPALVPAEGPGSLATTVNRV